MSKKSLRFCSVLAVVYAVLPATSQQIGNTPPGPRTFEEYINQVGPVRTKVESVLVLGKDNSPADAAELVARGVINPLTGKPFDRVYAFGMSGNSVHVKIWEGGRVIADNLQGSMLTMYEHLRDLDADYVVAHSNGNDVVVNALRWGLLRINKVFVAMAPPAGFKNQARFLPVPEIRIKRRQGDLVPELLGKAVIPFMELAQKLGHVEVGVIPRDADRSGDPLFGPKITRTQTYITPKIEERVWDNQNSPFPLRDRYYFHANAYSDFIERFPYAKTILDRHRNLVTDSNGADDFYIDSGDLSWDEQRKLGKALPELQKRAKGLHAFRTYMDAWIHDEIRDTARAIVSAVRNGADRKTREGLWSKLQDLRGQSQAASEQAAPHIARAEPHLAAAAARQVTPRAHVHDMWTWEGPEKTRGQTDAEVRSMLNMATKARKVIIAGHGYAASMLRAQMIQRLGPDKVTSITSFASKEEVRRKAQEIGADTVLGVETGEGSPDEASRRRRARSRRSNDDRGGVSAQMVIGAGDFVPGKK
jgi:hypothetical protein